MSSQSQPPNSRPKERVIVYIDGFNLYFGLKSGGLKKHLWLDVHGLSQALLKPHQTLVEVKYFSARISQNPRDPNRHLRQTTYLEALATLPDTSLHFGHYLAKTVECKRCHASWTKQEEKMTDVNIAVEMLTDSFQDRFDTAIVVSGDSDLAGPVMKIRKLSPTKRILAAFPPKSVSERLKREASAWLHIGADKIRQNQLPDPVKRPGAVDLHKPSKWK